MNFHCQSAFEEKNIIMYGPFEKFGFFSRFSSNYKYRQNYMPNSFKGEGKKLRKSFVTCN